MARRVGPVTSYGLPFFRAAGEVEDPPLMLNRKLDHELEHPFAIKLARHEERPQASATTAAHHP